MVRVRSAGILRGEAAGSKQVRASASSPWPSTSTRLHTVSSTSTSAALRLGYSRSRCAAMSMANSSGHRAFVRFATTYTVFFWVSVAIRPALFPSVKTPL